MSENDNPRKVISVAGISIFQFHDNYNFSKFLFTNSLKSLPFSKFFEIKAKLCYPKMSEWVPVSIITNTSRLSSLAQTSNQSGLM